MIKFFRKIRKTLLIGNLKATLEVYNKNAALLLPKIQAKLNTQ